MKTSEIIVIIVVLSILPILAVPQEKKMKGTYIYSNEEEYIQIDKDAFRIIRTRACTPCVDLDEGDSIASYGSVKYIQDGFIKLKSYRDSSIYRNTIIVESYDERIKDSVKIRFVFPFKGKYRIDAALGDSPYISTENEYITIPKKRYTLNPLDFNIYNLSLKYNGYYGDYWGHIVFHNFPWYQFKNKDTNSLLITIPDLTNSYYAHYIINGDYVKVEKDKIIWRNREYRKVSDDLITPKVELGERAIDDINGVDWVDGIGR